MADEDKTEEATSHKLEEAREKGDVANSKDFTNFIVFGGFVLSFYFFSHKALSGIVDMFPKYFDLTTMHLEDPQDFLATCIGMIKQILLLVGPLFAVVTLFAVIGSVAQFGFLYTTEKVMPDWERINPISGLSRLFSKDIAMELLKSTIKVVIVSFLFYLVLKGEVSKLIELGSMPMAGIFYYFMGLIAKVAFVMLLFMGILGIADLGYQKWSYAQKMKMSMQEVKDEHKQRDGNPLIRSRIRQIQRERVRKMMMNAVPKADVVVTNPTHVAVALQYQRGVMRAPVVVAKGAGYIAVKIKEIAALSEVPILERKQLARYLYKNVEVNEAIPESLYTAVAEVLAYVYRVKNKFKQMTRRSVPAT